MGLEIRHGLRNASRGGHKRRGVGVVNIPGNATREALKAMAGQASLPAPLCGPSSPSLHATTREGEGEQGGVGGGGDIRLCCVWCVAEPTSSALTSSTCVTSLHFAWEW